MTMPSWANEVLADVWEIDIESLYPQIIEEIAGSIPMADVLSNSVIKEQLKNFNPKKLDQYWLEVVYQFAKLELRRALIMEGRSPWPKEIRMQIDSRKKEKWQQKQYPPGVGAALATKGKHARELYRFMRGFIPN